MKILLVAKNELIKSLRNKKKLILGLIVPILAVLVAIGVNSIMKPNISIGIINDSNTNISSNFKDEAEKIEGITVKEAKVESLNTDMILGNYSCVISFKTNNDIDIYALDSNLKSEFNEIANTYISTGELNQLENIIFQMREGSMSVAERSVGFILLTFMITSTIAACTIIKDKDDGALMRITFSIIKPWEYILGNFLYNLLNGVLQIVLSSIVLSVLPINMGIEIIEFLFLGVIIVFISSSFASFVVSFSDSDLKASSIASSFAMILALFGGVFLPLDKMPDTIKFLSNGSAFRWIIEFTQKIEGSIISFSIMPIIIIIAISSLCIVASLVLGKRKFLA